MKKIILITFISLAFLSVKAQENESSESSKSEPKQKYHALGFNAGFSTGLGLSHRYQSYKHSFQTSFLPIATNDLNFMNLGFRYAYDIRENNGTKFFGYLGHSASYIMDKYYDLDYFSGESIERTSENYRFVTGAGFGIDQELSKSTSLNFSGGYAYYIRSASTNIFTLTAEVGLFYKFN
jgi:hypothetical protein